MKKTIFHPLVGVALAFVILVGAWTTMIWISVKNAPEQIPVETKTGDERN